MAKKEFYIRVGVSGNDTADFRKREGQTLKNDYGLDLGIGYYYKQMGKDRLYKEIKIYVITELHTGMSLSDGETRKEAIENMRSNIERAGGIEAFKQKITDYVAEHGESPLYKVSCTYLWGKDKA